MLKKWILILLTGFILSSCTSHGNVKEFDGLELFYQDDIEISEVDKLGNYLTKVNFTKGEGKSLQLLKTDTSFTLKMVVTEKTLKNDSALVRINDFHQALKQNLYTNTYFELHLCDKYFNTTKVLK